MCVFIYTTCKKVFTNVNVDSVAILAVMAPNKVCQGFKMAISLHFETMVRMILASFVTFLGSLDKCFPLIPSASFLDKFLPLIVFDL